MVKKCQSLMILVLLLAYYVSIPNTYSSEIDGSSHPIFSEKNWRFDDAKYNNIKSFCDDDDNREVMCGVERDYTNSDGHYVMSETAIFGEVVKKHYGVVDEKTRSRYGYTYAEFWALVEKDGKWWAEEKGWWKHEHIRDETGRLIAVVVILQDRSRNEVTRRTVLRKGDETRREKIGEEEKLLIDQWLEKNNLDDYGNKGIVLYGGGPPPREDRYHIIVEKYSQRPWFNMTK